MKTLIYFSILVAAALAQPAAVNPKPVQWQAEIASAHRDLLLAEAKMRDAVDSYNAAKDLAQRLGKALTGSLAEASKTCPSGQKFDLFALACVAPAKDGDGRDVSAK